MGDQARADQKLIEEISALRQRIKALEESDSERRRSGKVIRSRQRLHEFAPTHSMEELLRKTLDELELLMYSQIGFFPVISVFP